jgi:hypothetical protein
MKMSAFSELTILQRLLVLLAVPLAVWFGLDWINTRQLNATGYCIPQKRFITDEEKIVAALYDSFDTKAELQSLTSFVDHRSPILDLHRPHRDFTKADVRAFLQTPLGKLCCKTAPTNDGDIWIAGAGSISEIADKYSETQKGRYTGQLGTYVILERRNIIISGDASLPNSLFSVDEADFHVVAVPVTNCGEVPQKGHKTFLRYTNNNPNKKPFTIDPALFPPAPRFEDKLKVTGEIR